VSDYYDEYGYAVEGDLHAELEDQFHADPVTYTAAIAGAAAQQAAAMTAQNMAYDHAALQTSQANVVGSQVRDRMEAKYGRDEWASYAPGVGEVLARNPGMIGHEATLNPDVLEQVFEDALAISNRDAQDNYVSQRWQEISSANSEYTDLKNTLGGGSF
jgi:hypothetical protein